MKLTRFLLLCFAFSIISGCRKAPSDVNLIVGKWEAHAPTPGGGSDAQAAMAKLFTTFFSPKLVFRKDYTYRLNLIIPSEGRYEFMGDTITLKPNKVMGKNEQQFNKDMSQNTMMFGRQDKAFETETIDLSKDGKTMTLNTPEGMPDITFHKTTSDDKLPSTVAWNEKPLVGSWGGQMNMGSTPGIGGHTGPQTMDVQLDLLQNNTFELNMFLPMTGTWKVYGNSVSLIMETGGSSMSATWSPDMKQLTLVDQSGSIVLSKEAN